MISGENMRKIVFTGPESSGKSTLARLISDEFGYPLVPEVARAYLSVISESYTTDHVIELARHQIDVESSLGALHRDFLICDTSIFVPRMWLLYRFGLKDQWIEAEFERGSDRFYFLCAPEIPWQKDTFRENPADRWSLFHIYHKQLAESQHPYKVLRGDLTERVAIVKEVMLSKN